MNRRDLLSFEQFYAATVRREADRRRKRYPLIAAKLDHWAALADARAEAIRCGPLFEGDRT